MIRKFTPILNLVTTAFLLCSIAYAQSIPLKNLKLKENKSVSTDTIKSNLTDKSPALAGALSFIAPGFALGQLYNEQYGKFITHGTIGVVSLTAFIISMHYVEIKLDMGGGKHEDDGNSNTAGAIAFFSAVIFAGNYIITVADAIVSAQNINKQYQQQRNRSMLEQRLIFGFTLEKNNQLKFKAILNL